MNKKRIIIGIAGKIASGKTTLAKMLVEKDGFTLIKIAEPIYFFCKKLGFPETRENLINICKIGKEYDPCFWLYILHGRMKKIKNNKIVIDDVRFIEDVKYIKSRGGIIIYLKVSPEIAYQRCLKRGEAKDKLSYEEFLKILQDPTEKSVEKIEKKGLFDLLIDTDDKTPEEIYKIVKKFIETKFYD